MKQLLEILVFTLIGTALLWFGYTLFFTLGIPEWGGTNNYRRQKRRAPKAESLPGDPQTCPVCSAKLNDGEMVKTTAYPSMNGGKDRFMHIKGCVYCLHGDRERICPVCGVILKEDEILICRFFERPGRRPHVHVLGCSHCKGPHKY